ncbi:uncharacterized protein PV07_12497 [Cladophialophora immunda]|uniref:Helicase C-terminal domain-containing protein n=1 Tax=Cladophialophora immunda TaxID=569365 RepID=A0A0D2BUK9_9EURO|nr:uncharacterized protein PV07_12497 [Cladophialophora immunda]KIW22080.1 hypothetical protein PV07_12497 [Cladophialophora immunda]
MGVDYAYVRNVFHYGLPSDTINFSQEVGHIGRDGRSSVSMVLLPRHARAIDDERWEREKHITPLSTRVMQRYMNTRCLGAVLSRFCRINSGVDGFDGLFNPGAESDITPWWDSEPVEPSQGRQEEGVKGEEGDKDVADVDEASSPYEGSR